MSMTPFLILFRCVFLAPVVPNNPPLTFFFTSISYLSTFSSVILFIWTFSTCNYFTSQSLTGIINGLSTGNLLVSHFLVAWNVIRTRHQSNNVLREINYVDSIFVQKLHQTNIKLNTITTSYAIKYFLIWFIFVSSFLHLWTTVEDKYNLLYILHPLCVLRIRTLQVMFYIDLVYTRMDLLNVLLDDLVDIWNKSDWNTQEWCYERLAILKSLYGRIWGLARLENALFGQSFFAISLESIAQLIIHSYVICASILSSNAPSGVARQSYMSVTIALVALSTLCWTCHKCTKKYNRIVARVGHIKSYRDDLPTRNCYCKTSIDQIKEETNTAFHALVDEFTLQLIHEKVRFDANGFFTINLPFLTTILGITTSNLLVLAQFQNFDDTDAFNPSELNIVC